MNSTSGACGDQQSHPQVAVLFICRHWWQSCLTLIVSELMLVPIIGHYPVISVILNFVKTAVLTSFTLCILSASHWLIQAATFLLFWNNGIAYLLVRLALLILQLTMLLGRPVGLLNLINRYLQRRWPEFSSLIEKKITEVESKRLKCSRVTLEVKSFKMGEEPPLMVGLMVTHESLWPLQPKCNFIDVIFLKTSACDILADCDLPVIGLLRCRIKAKINKFVFRFTISRIRGKLNFAHTVDLLDDVTLELEVLGAENTMINWMLNTGVVVELVIPTGR